MRGMFSVVVVAMVSLAVQAATLGDWVNVEQDAIPETETIELDDYVRLRLPAADYQRATRIARTLEARLGPGVVDLRSPRLLLLTAPRDPNERMRFIADVLAIEMPD